MFSVIALKRDGACNVAVLVTYDSPIQIIKIIGDNIPQLEAIQLSHNKLRTLDGFETLSTRAPSVKILYLSDNNVSLYLFRDSPVLSFVSIDDFCFVSRFR